MNSSCASLSSIEAPSDEERNEEGKLRPHNGGSNKNRVIYFIGTKALPKRTHNQWSIPFPKNDEKGAHLMKRNPVCRFRYDEMNSIGANESSTNRSELMYNTSLHSRSSHNESDYSHDYNKKHGKFSSRPRHLDLSNGQINTAADKTGRSRHFLTRASLALTTKKNSILAKIMIASTFIFCIVFLSVVTELGSVIYSNDLITPKQNPPVAIVAYGVEHGREIPFPPQSREKSLGIAESISMVEDEKDIKSDAKGEIESHSVLHTSSRPVIDAPKYIPNPNGRRSVKPIVAYAKTGRKFHPKFVVADASDNIEKFVLDESRPLEHFELHENNNFLNWFSFLGLTTFSGLIALLFIYVQRSRISINRGFNVDRDFISI